MEDCFYAYFGDTGQIRFTSYSPQGTVPPEVEGLSWIELSPGQSVEGMMVADGALVPQDASLQVSLARADMLLAIKAIRQDVEKQGFTHGGAQFDTSPDAQARISAVVTQALISKLLVCPFSVDWKLADNSVMTFGADEMLAVGQAFAAHIRAAHSRYQELKAEIEGSDDPNHIRSLTW